MISVLILCIFYFALRQSLVNGSVKKEELSSFSAW